MGFAKESDLKRLEAELIELKKEIAKKNAPPKNPLQIKRQRKRLVRLKGEKRNEHRRDLSN